MEKKTLSPQLVHRRKFFLFLPLLVLPFTTLLFWSLGGGQGNDAVAGQNAAKGGLNMQLPDAYLKEDGALTKLSYYEKAARDSARLEEQLRSDPYYQLQAEEGSGAYRPNDSLLAMSRSKQAVGGNSLNQITHGAGYTDPQEARVYQKLGELNAVLNQTASPSEKKSNYSTDDYSTKTAINSTDIDRLEQMMNLTKGNDSEEDSEMDQLNTVMEKILDIQHPERVKERLKQTLDSSKPLVYAVSPGTENGNTSLLGSNNHNPDHEQSLNGFFSLDDNESSIKSGNAIRAVIHETQTVGEGAFVKLRLLSDITVNGTRIPNGTFVFGSANLNSVRLAITVKSIFYKNTFFPVHLSVVGMDGLEGIFLPETNNPDIARQSAERAMQGIGITSLDPSLGAKAATAGIEAARTLLNKKPKQVQVIIKAGYQVLLRDVGLKDTF